jgi:thiamine transport system ATP-binding protein
MELTLTNIRKEYGEAVALGRESAGVDLTVEDGEFFTLVGPSGCGKTTTLRLVAGFEPTTTGRIAFDGREMAGVPPEDRNVGVVFQNYALFPHMTVGENVAYSLNFADPPGGVSDEERVAQLLGLVHLPDTQGRDPRSLSGGQRQRVAIARALAPGPELLLLDEPMSALDAKLRERLRVQVREIQQELDITTVYVTHDQEEALAVSDRVAVLNEGTVEQVATPRDIYHRPESRFVAEFVGDNNVFEGKIEAVDGDTATVAVSDETLRVGLGDWRGSSVSEGDRLTFCVRPEGLAVGSGTNQLTARVTSAEFLGETTRVRLDWSGQELMLRTREALEGDVVVGFNPGDARVVECRD